MAGRVLNPRSDTADDRQRDNHAGEPDESKTPAAAGNERKQTSGTACTEHERPLIVELDFDADAAPAP